MDFPTLETKRLILNQPTESDLEDLSFHLNQTSEFAENTLNIPHPYLEEDGRFWIEEIVNKGFESKTNFTFAIREKENLKLIGGIGIHTDRGFNKAEAGYWLGKDFWNKGYVSEALEEILRFGFEHLNLNKIYATHFPHNPASGNVMQKVGMQQEGVLRQDVLKGNNY